MRRAATLAVAVLLTVWSAAAQNATGSTDVVGAWNMSYTTTDGKKMASVLTLKLEEGALTGTISSPRGSVPIAEATVNGDRISFAVIKVGFGDRIRIDYTGTVKGDSMKLSMKPGPREAVSVTATRAPGTKQ